LAGSSAHPFVLHSHRVLRWVIEGETPEPAGTFAGGGTQTAFALTRPVPEGATVAVTIEPEGGSESPTGDVQFSASGV